MVSFNVAMRFVDNASRPMRSVMRASDALANSTGNLATQFNAADAALIGLTTSIAAGAAIAITEAAKLESALARLATVTSTLTMSQATSLADSKKQAKEFSEQWAVSSSEVIRAQFEMATAGIPVEEQMVATQAAFKLAEATMGEFVESSRLLGSFLNTFGKSAEFNFMAPAEKMEAITDRLSVAVQKFQVTLPVLAESFKFIVGPASQLNLALAETAAAIGVLNTAGFRGTLAGTALSNMFNKLDRATSRLNLNPDKFIDLNGDLRSTIDFLKEVDRALGGMTSIEAQNKLIEVFDIRAGRVAKTLLDNIPIIEKQAAVMEMVSGETERMAKHMKDTTRTAGMTLVNMFSNLAETVGAMFNPTIRTLIGYLKEVLSVFKGILTVTGPLVPSMIVLAATFAGTALAIRGILILSGAFVAFWKTLTVAITAAKVAGTAFTVSMVGVSAILGAIAIGLGLTVGAVALVGAAIAGVIVVGRDLTKFITGIPKINDKATKSYDNFASGLGHISQELKLLHSIWKADSKFFETPDIGSLPVSNLAERLNPTGTTSKEAIQEAIMLQGGFEGVTRQIAKQVKFADEQHKAFYDSFIKWVKPLDREWKEITSIEASDIYGRSIVDSMGAMFASISDGSEEGIQSLIQLNNSLIEFGKNKPDALQLFGPLIKFNPNGDNAIFEKSKQEIFENFQSNVERMRFGPSPALRKAANEFKELSNMLGEDFNADNVRFLEMVVTLTKEFKKELVAAQIATAEVHNALSGVSSNIQQTDRSIKSVADLMNNASLEAGNFAENVDISNKRLVDARNSMKAFGAMVPAIKKLQDEIDKIVGRDLTLEERNFKKIDVDKVLGNFKIALNNAENRIEADRWVTMIARRFGRLEDVIADDVKRIGKLLETTIGKSLSGELGKPGKTLSEALTETIQSDLKAKLFEGLGQLLATGLAADLKKADHAMGLAVKDLWNKGVLEASIESGLLEKKVEEAVGKINPNLANFIKPFEEASKDIKQISDTIRSSISDALTGELQQNGKTLFKSLANDVRQLFIADISGVTSMEFAKQFQAVRASGIETWKSLIEEFKGRPFDLDLAIQSGTITQQFNDLMQKLHPEAMKLFEGDLFKNTDLSKLQQSFREISNNMEVSAVTAGATTLSYLSELNSIISEGPAKTAEGLNRQINEVKNTLSSAFRNGSDEAVRYAEGLLKALLEQQNNNEMEEMARRIAGEMANVEQPIMRASRSFMDAVASLIPAGKEFIDIITTGMESAFNMQTDTIVTDTPKVLEIRLQLGTKRIEVDINKVVSGVDTSDGISAEEIQSIIESVKAEMKLEQEETIRRLEDELRRR